MLRFITAVGLFLSPTAATNPEPCINSFTDVASNAIARSVFTHCIDIDAAAERHTTEDIEITDPLTTLRKYCPLSISTKMFHSAFYEILSAGWATPSDEAPPSRFNAIVGLTNLAKKEQMNHEARRKLGNLLSHIYRDHLHDGGHCLTMEDRKAAIEDMETTLYKVRNIVGSIQYADLLYLKNTFMPVVTLESEDDLMNLKKTGSAGDGSSADHLRIMLDKPSAVYMSLTNGAPNSALIVGEDNNEIDLNLLYKSILKDTTPGTVLFLVTGAEFPINDPRLVNIIAGNAQNKNILINVILLDPKYVTDVSKIMYKTLALSTGGMMYETARRQASDLIPIIESRFQPDQVTIVRNQRIPVTGRGSSIVDIPVDSTMSELIFEVFCPSLESLMIYNPRYRPQRDIDTLVSTRNHFLYSVKNVEPGNWQAQVKCQTDFYIEVRGQSPVDFFFTFANTNGEFKSTSPFGLNPKDSLNADEESKYLLVHSLGVENVELQSVQFKDENKINEDRVSPLYLVESLVSAFPMPLESESLEEKTFQMAKIEGIDQSGFPVLRTHVIFPSKILLLSELEKTDFLPGVDSTVTIRVTNAYREIDLAANDFEDWIVDISPSKTAKTYYTDVVVTIRPPANTEQGRISSVTFTASAEEQKVLLGSITFDVAAGQRAKPTIQSLHIDTQINNKFATTSIKSNIRNDHPEPREAVFDALVPPNALITGLRLFIGEEVFDSEIYPAKAVEKKPTDANKSKITIHPHPSEMIKGHSPGGNLHGLSAPQILQRDAHRYEIKMNIDSWDNVTFELTYEELLERSQDRYQHWVSLAPSQIVPDMSSSIQINDMGGIKWIRAFPLQSGSESFRPGSDAEIKWEQGDQYAEVHYAPSQEDQTNFSQDGITGRLMLVYDTNHEKACDAMIQNNFFVQTCLPPKIMLKSNAQSSSSAPYNVVFVMDKSGSMIGTKLDQTKDAFRSMISSLDRNAKFSIVGFNYATNAWRNKLVRATNYNIEEARSFISRISAGGGTNMHAALLDAIELCNSESSSTVPCMIMFMTDGTATVGVTEESRILADVTKSRQQGKANIALNVIGFGAGISYSFLSRLSVLNSGIARQIFEDTNAAFQMQGFFDEVMKFTDARRTMKSVQFMYSDEFLDSNETTYDSIDQSQLGNGQEFTFAGKIKEKVLGTFKTVSNDLKITDPNGEERVIEQKYIVNEIMSPVNLKFAGRKDDKNVNLNLAERIYRLQVIKQLIKERQIAHTAEDFNEVTRKLIAISSGNEHVSAYLSPVMSMSVTKPLMNRARRSSDSFEEFDLNLKSPVQHVVQYEYRKLWWKNQAPEENVMEMEAPEPSIASVSGIPALFSINIQNSQSPACFDIGGRSGSEFNILRDDTVGISVSAKAALDKDDQLYFDQIRVKLGSTTIIVLAGGQILKQTFDGAIYRLESDKMILVKDWQVRSTGSDCYLQYKDQIQIRLISDSSSVGVELVSYEDGNSRSATGLLGQFASNNLALDQSATNLISSSSVIPVLSRQIQNGQCWFTDDYTMKLLGRRYSDYIN